MCSARSRRALVLLLGTLTVWGIGSAAAPPSASEPATWIRHDIVVQLQNLPKRYSCDDLWYKFRDVLLKLGARPNMQILAYRCESVLGPIARSPTVHLQFDMPQALQGKDVRWAEMQASPRTVRLAPGDPASLDTADCDLLRQIKSALLPALSEHVLTYHLACQADPTSHPNFGLSVQALIPATASDTRLAARSDSAPKLSDSMSPAAAAHVR